MSKTVIDLSINFPFGRLSPQQIKDQLHLLPYPVSDQQLFDDGKFILRVSARQSAARLQSDLDAQVGPLLSTRGIGWNSTVISDAGSETAESVLVDVLSVLEQYRSIQGVDRQQLDALSVRIHSVLAS